MNKKAIFLDIDGTLMDNAGHIPDSAIEAMKKAKENGHDLFLCSGRCLPQISPVLVSSDLFTGMICSGGTHVVVNGKTLTEQIMRPERLSEVVDYLEKRHSVYFLQCSDGLYISRQGYKRAISVLGYGEISQEKLEEIFGKITVVDEAKSVKNCSKIAYYGLAESLADTQAGLGDYFTVIASSFKQIQEGLTDGEIAIAAYPKTYGMKVCLDYLGLTNEDAIAFGDGPNDLEMMEYANVGVAMGNALDTVKAKADLVTSSLHEDGIKKGFEMTGLISNRIVE